MCFHEKQQGGGKDWLKSHTPFPPLSHPHAPRAYLSPAPGLVASLQELIQATGVGEP